MTTVCYVCHGKAVLLCPCRQRAYCSVLHQSEDWNNGHRESARHRVRIGGNPDNDNHDDEKRELTVVRWNDGKSWARFPLMESVDGNKEDWVIVLDGNEEKPVRMPIGLQTPMPNIDQLEPIFAVLSTGIQGDTIDLLYGGSGDFFDQFYNDLKWTIALNRPGALRGLNHEEELPEDVISPLAPPPGRFAVFLMSDGKEKFVVKPSFDTKNKESTPEQQITAYLSNLPVVSVVRVVRNLFRLSSDWVFGESAPFAKFAYFDWQTVEPVNLMIMERVPATFDQVVGADPLGKYCTAAQFLCEMMLIFKQVSLFYHSDIHLGNIMFGEPLDVDYLVYQFAEGESWTIPIAATQHRRVVLLDFGRTVLQYYGRNGQLVTLGDASLLKGITLPRMWRKFMWNYLDYRADIEEKLERVVKIRNQYKQAEILLLEVLARIKAPVNPPPNSRVLRIVL